MKNSGYMQVLREMSSWRIVPGYKSGGGLLEKLKQLLDDIPCYISENGDLVIGADSAGSLPRSGLCLRAYLPGGGGVVKKSADGKFLFSEITGIGPLEVMLGRKFGAYSPLEGGKICDLEVERVYSDRHNQTLYFLAPAEALKAAENPQAVVVTYPSCLELSPGDISCWNLSSLLNAALVVSAVKEFGPRDGIIGMLHRGAQAVPAGLFPVEFGPDNGDKVNIPCGYTFNVPGHSGEGAVPASEPIFVPAGAIGAATSLHIENRCNRAANGTFAPETVPVERLDSYLRLVSTLIRSLEKSSLLLPNRHDSETIEVNDEAPRISRLVSGAADFAAFLGSGMPEIAQIYKKYGLSFAAIKESTFENLRQILSLREAELTVNVEEIKSWASECSLSVRGLLPGARRRNISLITVLMLPSGSASSCSGDVTVYISPDRIGRRGLRTAVYTELSCCLARAALDDLGLPPRLARYYSEGIKYALIASVTGAGLAETLQLSPEKFDEFSKEVASLKEKMALYLSGETLRLYEGKYHRYFQGRALEDPYAVAPDAGCGYGSFLAAVEVSTLMLSGKLYETILSN